ncbi:MAG: iron-sulfur cluster repair di-iron protein [Acidobacteria bacterium]|nr:iron-sulfur cluster repair di-iron protein [Acidobacteriota bacterium]
MLMKESKTVRELVVSYPGASRVFEKAGIDYCCGGGRSLDEACQAVGVSVNEVLHKLEELPEFSLGNTTEKNWATEPLKNLISFIVETHHVFTKNELARLEKLLAKVCTVHGENHPELWNVNSLFIELKNDLLPHMFREEQVLFPYINALQEADTNHLPAPTPFFGTVQNPIRMMSLEHDAVGDILRALRQASHDFAVPEGTCISYATLYQALQEFEQDLHQHIHLENNFLFPRAIELEAAI